MPCCRATAGELVRQLRSIPGMPRWKREAEAEILPETYPLGGTDALTIERLCHTLYRHLYPRLKRMQPLYSDPCPRERVRSPRRRYLVNGEGQPDDRAGVCSGADSLLEKSETKVAGAVMLLLRCLPCLLASLGDES